MLSLSFSLSFSSPIGGLQIRYDSSGSLPGPGLLGTGGGGEMMPPVATSIEQLLERQWNEGQNFLMQQGAQGDGEETHRQTDRQTVAHSRFCKTKQKNHYIHLLRFASFLTFYQLIRCPLPFHQCHLPLVSLCLVSRFLTLSVIVASVVLCQVSAYPDSPLGGLESENEKKAVRVLQKVTAHLEELGCCRLLI